MATRSAVAYSKDLRDRAKSENKRLITIDYNGKYTSDKCERVTFQLIETPGTVKAIESALAVVLKEWVERAKESKGERRG